MSANIVTAIYIAASVLFILSLGGLSNQESAKRAVWYGIVGMALAVGATIFGPQVEITLELMLMIAVGSVIGLVVARRVEMTGMPQLVAALHTFVGAAAVFIGINSHIAPPAGLAGAELIIHEVEIFLGVFIGAVTTTGSIIAFGNCLLYTSDAADGRAPAAEDHRQEVPVHRAAHDIGQDRARRADQRAGDDQQVVAEKEAGGRGRPARIGIQHRDDNWHVSAADGHHQMRAEDQRDGCHQIERPVGRLVQVHAAEPDAAKHRNQVQDVASGQCQRLAVEHARQLAEGDD